MILVDTSVWVNHLRVANEFLAHLMSRKEALTHPFVIGELAMGIIRERAAFMIEVRKLPTVHVATNDEVMLLVERHRLFGTGIGYIDAHLLAAAQFADNVVLW